MQAKRSQSIRTPTSRLLLSRPSARQALPPWGGATKVGATVIPVTYALGFRDDQTIIIDTGCEL